MNSRMYEVLKTFEATRTEMRQIYSQGCCSCQGRQRGNTTQRGATARTGPILRMWRGEITPQNTFFVCDFRWILGREVDLGKGKKIGCISLASFLLRVKALF